MTNGHSYLEAYVMKRVSMYILIGILLVLPAQVFATFPDYYPSSYRWAGTVDDINLRARSILIGDDGFTISSATRVHTLSAKNASWYTLKRGMTVGCDYRYINRKKVVTHIWVLPNGYRAQID